MISTVNELVSYIEGIPKVVKKNTMADTKAFYQHLGSPGVSCKVIHVAGTNGKGSVCAFLNSILMESGYRVGLFTSPHLVDTRERIRVNGQEIPEDAFLELGNDLISETYKPSYFEFLYFLGMLWFEKQKVDFILLETGLGGRLDATNSFPNPVLDVITTIGMDHMEYLGNTLEQIAGEKAGILKAHVPLVYLEGTAEVNKVFEQAAADAQSETYMVRKDHIHVKSFHHKGIDFSYYGGYDECKDFCISMRGLYQCENAALAIRCAALLQDMGCADIPLTCLQNGLLKTNWQGRMECVSERFFIDGAHNPEGIAAFLKSAGQMPCSGQKVLMFSVVADKDYSQMAEEIVEADLFSEIVLVPLETSRRAGLEQIEECFLQAYEERGEKKDESFFVCKGEAQLNVPKLHSYDSVTSGYEHICSYLEKHTDDMAFAVGSLYLVGQIKGISR